jgi:hypothetical protein
VKDLVGGVGTVASFAVKATAGVVEAGGDALLAIPGAVRGIPSALLSVPGRLEAGADLAVNALARGADLFGSIPGRLERGADLAVNAIARGADVFGKTGEATATAVATAISDPEAAAAQVLAATGGVAKQVLVTGGKSYLGISDDPQGGGRSRGR